MARKGSRKASRKSTRKSTRKNARRGRKANTRKQSGGFLKRFFGSKPVAAPTAPIASGPSNANKNAAAMNAAREYVNKGKAAGKTAYQISSNADEDIGGMISVYVKKLLKNAGEQVRSY